MLKPYCVCAASPTCTPSASKLAIISLPKSSVIGLLLSSKKRTVSEDVHFQFPKDNNPSILKLCVNLYAKSISIPLCRASMPLIFALKGTSSTITVTPPLAGLFCQTV